MESLTPSTLAAIVADILRDKADGGTSKGTDGLCEQAYQQGIALVGKNEFDQMVEGLL